MIPGAGGAAFVLRRVSGAVLAIYFVAWLARLHAHPLLPFGGDLGRSGSVTGKLLEVALIALLSIHALEGASQVAVERLRLMHKRLWLVLLALALGLLIGAAHVPYFFAGVLPP